MSLGILMKLPVGSWSASGQLTLFTAMMEYHSNKEAPVAIRIFELGLKSFSEETHYVISYLQFLLSINDDTSESISS